MEDRWQAIRNNRAVSRRPELRLTVTSESFAFFTTVLQYGVEIETRAPSLGRFLVDCPGFSEDYILEAVQTIFLDGIAIDDLKTPLSGPHPVIALSAAMPGLAGAIFRKNGLHSSLRTPLHALDSSRCDQGPMTVTLKLFNRIAREKGEGLLSPGAKMAASSLSAFLSKRTELHSRIKTVTVDTEVVSLEELPAVLPRHEYVTLFVSPVT
jgi:hypothetical protein